MAELLDTDATEALEIEQRTIDQLRLVSLAVPAWDPERAVDRADAADALDGPGSR